MTVDSIVLGTDDSGGLLAFPLSSVIRIDVRRSRELSATRIAGYGGLGLLGGAILGGVGLYTISDYEGDDKGLELFFGGLAGGAVGLVTGMFVGAFIKTERWEEVPLGALRVQPVATPDGRFGLTASVRLRRR
jgi:hypothetical protein